MKVENTQFQSEAKEGVLSVSDRIILVSDDDAIRLMELVPGDSQTYFDLIDSNRAHHSQFGDSTAVKYFDVESVVKSIKKQRRDKKLRFGIWEDKDMVGFISLTFKNNNNASTGSWVASHHTGNNYAARARNVLLKFAFENLGIGEVASEIVVGNEVSRKSVEKSGYHLQEITIDAGRSIWRYIITNSEWKEKAKKG